MPAAMFMVFIGIARGVADFTTLLGAVFRRCLFRFTFGMIILETFFYV